MNTTQSPLSAPLVVSRGSALVMTLMILVLITVIVLGVASIVRIENPTSASHEERTRANLFSRMGADMATGILRNEIADPANLSRPWVSQPGALIVSSSGSKTADTEIALHTGVPSNYDPNQARTWASPAQLNIRSLGTTASHLITEATAGGSDAVHLPVRWIYVRQDGTFDTAEAPSTNNATNPLVGRFAYWVDDDSTKLNVNTAWKRNAATSPVANSFSPSHPSSISLTAIPGITEEMADKLHAQITPLHRYNDAPSVVRFFNTVNEVRRLDRLTSTSGISAAVNKARFDLTTYSHSPDLTFFNEPRIVLTTQERFAPRDSNGNILRDDDGVPYFLDILADDRVNQDPGTIKVPETGAANIDSAKLNKVMKKLMSYLTRTDWPMVTGSNSFQAKYYGNDQDSLAQLAVNIIDYVRAAESPRTLVEPIRGILSGGNFSLGGGGGANKSVKGITRNLFFTEMGFWVNVTAETTGPNTGRNEVRYLFELHLPPHFGLSSIDLTDIDGMRLTIWTQSVSNSAGKNIYDREGNVINFTSGTTFLVNEENIVGGSGVNGKILNAGGYVKLAFPTWKAVTSPSTIDMRSAFQVTTPDPLTPQYPLNNFRSNKGERMDIVPVASSLNYTVYLNFDPEDKVKTYQVDDPCVNSNLKDWNLNGLQLNTFGKAPTSPVRTLDGTSTTIPPQDINASGQITNVGIRMPAPKGSPENPAGIVYSPGELGHIHTGLQPNNSASKGGTPWRTLRLQPEGNASVVPDWAFMDLFTVPTDIPDNAKRIFAPHGASVGGRININSQLKPYGAASGERPANTAVLERLLPLIGTLMDIEKDSAGTRITRSEAEAMARNILTHQLATNAVRYGSASADVYDSPGEIAQIAGIADQGEDSESIIRGLANLITTRSNVFTIYSVGQALKQKKSGGVVVTAEQRAQTTVERRIETAPASADLYRLNTHSLNP